MIRIRGIRWYLHAQNIDDTPYYVQNPDRTPPTYIKSFVIMIDSTTTID